MFLRHDNEGRNAEILQDKALNWLETNLDLNKFNILSGPTGLGKSFISKVVIDYLGGAVIVPNNNLLTQYNGTYTSLNHLKGQSHYYCKEHDTNCGDVRALKLKVCGDCEYSACRRRAVGGASTVFNPLSFYYVTRSKAYQEAESFNNIIIVDEAHQLISMLSLLLKAEFNILETPFKEKELKNNDDLLNWLSKTRDIFKDLMDKTKNNQKENIKWAKKYVKACRSIYSLEKEPNNYIFTFEKRFFRGNETTYLVIEPVKIPQYIFEEFFDSTDKVILMSGTMLQHDIKEIVGDNNYSYLDLPSPIPIENRHIYLQHNTFKDTTGVRVERIAKWIVEEREKAGNPNTLVHVTYDLSRKLHKLLPQAFIHTNENKNKVIEKFKKQGGILLGAGCAEGVDLPDDLCRLNLIPLLPFANYGSPLVKGRIRVFGRNWYNLDCLKTLIQMCGRSTRHKKDKSKIVIGDKRALKLIGNHMNQIPKYFTESLKW